jgi:predicted CoA-binding protein
VSDGEAEELLRTARSVLVIDWPSRDVPESLVRAGYLVIARGGPGPDDFNVYEVVGEEVTVRRAGQAPARIDVVYCHRPMSELPGIVAMARTLGARAVWLQSGLAAEGVRDPAGCWLSAPDSRQARAMVEAAGMQYIESPYIVSALRQLLKPGTARGDGE